MAYVLVALAAVVVSGLTLFSGFGLGTLLMPVLALFFSVQVAVAATAIVHGANNVLKVSLFGRHADFGAVIRFGLPAMAAAFAGARLLAELATMSPLAEYELLGRAATVTPIKAVVAGLMIVFAAFELVPRLRELEIDRRYLVVGGVLSGFFGGLSGHQGALRSAFLAKLSITPKAFVGTNAVIGLLVDATRLTVYGATFLSQISQAKGGEGWNLVAVATVSAFAGVVVGKRLLDKVTIASIRTITGIMLLLLAGAIGSGVI